MKANMNTLYSYYIHLLIHCFNRLIKYICRLLNATRYTQGLSKCLQVMTTIEDKHKSACICFLIMLYNL